MSDPSPNESLDVKVSNWLSEQGYPLEFETADQLRLAGLQSRLGMYFDASDGTSREIDVMGYTDPVSSTQDGFTSISAQVVVECKWSRNAPWVILCQEEHRSLVELLSMAIMSKEAMAGWMLNLCQGKIESRDSGCLQFPSLQNAGYSVVQALRQGNRDVPYNAITKVISAARAISQRPGVLLKRFEDLTSLPMRAWHFVVPCIVLNAPLYVASYAATKTGFTLRQVDWGRIHWMSEAPSAVTVVTRNALPEFAKGLVTAMQAFVETSTRLVGLGEATSG